MSLTNINTPKHVVGKSLEPIMNNVNASVRGSAQLDGVMDIQ